MTAIDRKFISNLTPFAVSYIFAPKFEGDDEELTDRDITIQRLHVRTKAADLGTYVGAEIIDTTPSMDCGEREDFINLLDFIDQYREKISCVIVDRLLPLTDSAAMLEAFIDELDSRGVNIVVASPNGETKVFGSMPGADVEYCPQDLYDYLKKITKKSEKRVIDDADDLV